MKRVIPIIIGTLALASCGGTKTVYVESTDAPDTTVKVVKTTDAPIATTPPVVWTAEDEFLFDIKSTVSVIGVSDYDLISTGNLVCDSLRNGATAADVIMAIVGVGYQQDFLIAVSASAVLNFCPDQQWKFDAL